MTRCNPAMGAVTTHDQGQAPGSGVRCGRLFAACAVRRTPQTSRGCRVGTLWDGLGAVAEAAPARRWSSLLP